MTITASLTEVTPFTPDPVPGGNLTVYDFTVNFAGSGSSVPMRVHAGLVAVSAIDTWQVRNRDFDGTTLGAWSAWGPEIATGGDLHDDIFLPVAGFTDTQYEEVQLRLRTSTSGAASYVMQLLLTTQDNPGTTIDSLAPFFVVSPPVEGGDSDFGGQAIIV